VEHVAEGQENNRGTSQGCSRGGDGVIKYFTISEKGDRGGYQKTITPSSLRYEDQVEVRLLLATLGVVLRNRLLIAWRPHPNVDVGWPAAVQRRHKAQALCSTSRSAFQHFSKNGKADLLKC
jgi:hypothetical protein